MYSILTVPDPESYFIPFKFTSLYLILDGASFPDVLSLIVKTDKTVVYGSIYENTIYDHLIPVSPYLIQVNVTHTFFLQFCADAYGTGAIAFTSQYDFTHIMRNLRKNIICTASDGQTRFFRYYDPRNLFLILQHTSVAFIQEIFLGAADFFMFVHDPFYSPTLVHFQKKEADDAYSRIP